MKVQASLATFVLGICTLITFAAKWRNHPLSDLCAATVFVFGLAP
jgi:hypothetical protein